MSNILYHKTCPKCKVTKRVSEFHLTTINGKRQRHAYCKECRNADRREYHKKRRAELNANSLAYYEDNKSEILKGRKKYYAENRESIKRKVLKRYYSEKKDGEGNKRNDLRDTG